MLQVADLTRRINSRASHTLQEALTERADNDLYDQMEALMPEDDEFNSSFLWWWETVSEIPTKEVFFTESVLEEYFTHFAVMTPTYTPVIWNEAIARDVPEKLTIDVGVMLSGVVSRKLANGSDQFEIPKQYMLGSDEAYLSVTLQEELAENDPFDTMPETALLDERTDLIATWSEHLLTWVGKHCNYHGYACLAVLPKLWALAVLNEFRPSSDVDDVLKQFDQNVIRLEFYHVETRLIMSIEFHRDRFITAIDRWRALVTEGRSHVPEIDTDAGEVQGA